MKNALLSLVLAVSPALAAEAPKAPEAKAAPAAKTAPAKTAPAKAAAAPAAPKDPYKTDDERSIYTIGFLMGRNLSQFTLTPAEVKIAQAGLADAALSKAPSVDVRFQQSRVNDLLQKRMDAVMVTEKAKGAAAVKKFLDAAKGKAVALSKGAYYLETKAGTGASPTRTSTIKANYRGTFSDGVEFDSSYSRGEPTEFSLAAVVSCWTDAFPLMKTGGKGEIICPSDAGYGDKGRPGVKPGAYLHFDVELVEIVPDTAPAKK